MFFLTVNILFPDGDNHPKSQKKPGPLWEGKRSAVAVVNDSPVGCQSCDRAARRRLSAIADWGSVLPSEVHPLRLRFAQPPEGELTRRGKRGHPGVPPVGEARLGPFHRRAKGIQSTFS